jgi:membrane-associated phospholipid phosphatase
VISRRMRSDETTTSDLEPSVCDRGGGSRVLGAVGAGWLLAGAVTLLAAVAIALAFQLHPLDRLDTAVAGWGYRATKGHDGLSAWWIGVAAYGQPMVLRAILVLGGLLLAWKRRWALAGWLVGISVAENVIAPLAKHLLNRPRPYWAEPITVEHSLSFPSGHAAAAGTFAAALTILLFATMSAGWSRRLAILSALFVGLIISLDRIFLGVHYLSDVIAGNALGVAVALTGWLVMLRLARDPRDHGGDQQS